MGTAATYSKAWYDQRASGCQYSEGESVCVLDSRGYRRRTPKWQLRFNEVGQVIRKLNAATYVVYVPGWRGERVLHVDKLRKMEATSSSKERPSPEQPAIEGREERKHGDESAERPPTAAVVFPRSTEKTVAAEGFRPIPLSDIPHCSTHSSPRKTRVKRPPKRYSPTP